MILLTHAILLALVVRTEDSPARPLTPRAVLGTMYVYQNVHVIAFSPRGDKIATGSEGRALRVLDLATGRESFPEKNAPSSVYSLAVTPDGKHVAVESSDYDRLRFYKMSDGQFSTHVSGALSSIGGIAFSPDGARLYWAKNPGEVTIWDRQQNKRIGTIMGAVGMLTSLAVSPNGQRIAAGVESGEIFIWDTNTSQLISTLRGHKKEIAQLSFADESMLVSAGWHGKTIVWDLTKRKQITTLDAVWFAITPDKRHLMILDGTTIQLISMRTGKVMSSAEMKAHYYFPRSMALSPDGKTLAVGSDCGRVFLWDVSRLSPSKTR